MTELALPGNGKPPAPWWAPFVHTLLQAGAVGAICLYVLIALGAKMDRLSEAVTSLNTSVQVMISKKGD